MGVDRPLIRPSTPFGQTSIHRSRKPAPCRALCLPSLFVSFASYLPPPTLPLFSTCPCSCSLSSRSSPPRRSLSRPTTATYPRADTFNLARIPRMHHLFLIVCLTRTHATGGWIQTRITRASIAQVCAHRVRTCPCPTPRVRVYIRSFVRGKDVIPSTPRWYPNHTVLPFSLSAIFNPVTGHGSRMVVSTIKLLLHDSSDLGNAVKHGQSS